MTPNPTDTRTADALVEYSPADDEETRAFIDGWNAAKLSGRDFDLALHFWMRKRCGI